MKLKNFPRKISGFAWEFSVKFLLKIRENEMVGKCRVMKKDTEVKTLQNGYRPEFHSYAGSRI